MFNLTFDLRLWHEMCSTWRLFSTVIHKYEKTCLFTITWWIRTKNWLIFVKINVKSVPEKTFFWKWSLMNFRNKTYMPFWFFSKTEIFQKLFTLDSRWIFINQFCLRANQKSNEMWYVLCQIWHIKVKLATIYVSMWNVRQHGGILF